MGKICGVFFFVFVFLSIHIEEQEEGHTVSWCVCVWIECVYLFCVYLYCMCVYCMRVIVLWCEWLPSQIVPSWNIKFDAIAWMKADAEWRFSSTNISPITHWFGFTWLWSSWENTQSLDVSLFVGRLFGVQMPSKCSAMKLWKDKMIKCSFFPLLSSVWSIFGPNKKEAKSYRWIFTKPIKSWSWAWLHFGTK